MEMADHDVFSLFLPMRINEFGEQIEQWVNKYSIDYANELHKN